MTFDLSALIQAFIGGGLMGASIMLGTIAHAHTRIQTRGTVGTGNKGRGR